VYPLAIDYEIRTENPANITVPDVENIAGRNRRHKHRAAGRQR